jgi:hypothetical protein
LLSPRNDSGDDKSVEMKGECCSDETTVRERTGCIRLWDEKARVASRDGDARREESSRRKKTHSKVGFTKKWALQSHESRVLSSTARKMLSHRIDLGSDLSYGFLQLLFAHPQFPGPVSDFAILIHVNSGAVLTVASDRIISHGALRKE